jgi:1-deoxy-D-xylulose-5-phosphate reductoisomerase
VTTTVAVAGSTGSIGRQTLEVVEAEAGRFCVASLAAARSVDALVAQAERHHPAVVVIGDESRLAEVRQRLPTGTEARAGAGAMAATAAEADVCVNGVVGFAGLEVTVAVLAAGRRLALANKESLIAGGPVVQPLRVTPGAELIPVDSEHVALHQCLRAGQRTVAEPARDVARLVLTASGGPFRGRSEAELAGVTVDEALAHPTWSMGPKITVDSSTLMNKGLEVIEAHELFGIGYDDIDVVVHPESIVHSMVTFSDGSTIAQLSQPDMRLPIGYALAWPDRIATPYGAIDWSRLGALHFEPPDRPTFRCLGLAEAAGRVGGSAPAWLSGANEVVVEAFLAGGVAWTGIAEVLDAVMQAHDGAPLTSIDDVIEADRRARAAAADELARRQRRDGGMSP